MVIEHGQRITAPFFQSEVAFEIHLPQVIGMRVLESLIRLMLRRSFRRDQLMAMKNRRDGARARNLWLFERLQAGLQFSSAPGRMPFAQLHHFLLDFCVGASRRVLRATRSIFQARYSLGSVTTQPFITDAWADAESAT